jgi:acetyl-CoA synthetase
MLRRVCSPAGRYWETVQRLKVNQLYTAPTAIRLLLKHGNEHVEKYDLTSLRTLGSVVGLYNLSLNANVRACV